MSYLSAADAWVIIVTKAYNELEKDIFFQWLDLVGMGDDFDRCKKGEKFYKMLTGDETETPIIEVPYERQSVHVQREEES